jgi:hypothetical protein
LEVSGELHNPRQFIPRKRPPIPIGQEAGWAQKPGLDATEKRNL